MRVWNRVAAALDVRARRRGARHRSNASSELLVERAMPMGMVAAVGRATAVRAPHPGLPPCCPPAAAERIRIVTSGPEQACREWSVAIAQARSAGHPRRAAPEPGRLPRARRDELGSARTSIRPGRRLETSRRAGRCVHGAGVRVRRRRSWEAARQLLEPRRSSGLLGRWDASTAAKDRPDWCRRERHCQRPPRLQRSGPLVIMARQ